LCFSDSCVIGSSGHYGGVAEHTLDWVKGDNAKWEIFNIDIPRPDLVRKFAQAQLGKKYDYTALYALPFVARDYSSPDKWFCSELVFAALQEGGAVVLSRVPKHRVTPAMIYSSPLLY
jgi:hypothetical protein